ncbi:MAG: type II secretion system protein GspC [Candidatus Binatus sp.]|uniref:type II secretion system protein GspC n=1 Tax=Candidatus Binatus sp. TaxID=2811406 RepID=UPI003C75D757
MEIRFTQLHVTILNFVLVGALAIVSAMCVRDIIERSVSNEPAVPAASAAAPKAAGPHARAYYDAIVKRDIFNEVPQESGPAPVVEEDLHLKLIGTSLQSKSKPYVIVEDDHNTESLYQMGEDIPDAGKLVAVETSRAIIDRDGHRVAIEIAASEIAEVPSSALSSAIKSPRQRGVHPAIRRGPHGFGRPGPNGQTDNRDDNSKAISNLKLKKLGPGKFEASRTEVQQTMENPVQFFSQMRAMPHFVNGKTDGFSISQVAPGSVFDQLGLQNGDLVTSIDGKPVTNPMQAMALMQAMKTQTALDLTVNRGGAPTAVHLDLK